MKFEKFEVIYFRSVNKEPLVTDDINFIRDLIIRLELWDYIDSEEVAMIIGYYSNGEFETIWTEEEGELISL